MDISQYDLVIKRHVFERAMQRGIHPDMIEDTLLKGKIKRFGKHGIKFINKGSKRTTVCVGELVGNRLKILTIEEGN
ncbi:hypothetical protein HYX06_02925 [Candidatus Woesearchaeota archaeon]|nr:hypothetical protein [Candidatus Woesearchaeota archaeon]